MMPHTVPNRPMKGDAEAMLESVGIRTLARCCSDAIARLATIGYNYIDKRVGDFLEELGASSEGWVALLSDDGRDKPVPLGRHAAFPAVRGGE